MRIHHFRIAIGAFFLFAAYGEKSWPMAIIGGILLWQGITKQSCGPAGCSIEDANLRNSKRIENEK